jgi:hypothetical protein
VFIVVQQTRSGRLGKLFSAALGVFVSLATDFLELVDGSGSFFGDARMFA